MLVKAEHPLKAPSAMLVWEAGMTTFPATTSEHPGWCAVGGAVGAPKNVGGAVGAPGANVGAGTNDDGGAVGAPGANVGAGTNDDGGAVGAPDANVGAGTNDDGGAVGPLGAAVGWAVGKQISERVTVIAVPVYWNVTVVGIVMLVSPGLD